MIRGVVNERCEAVLRLRLRGPDGVELDVDAIVDTGFSSSLTLPSAVIALLGLVRESSTSAKLGDGSIRRFDIYAAEIDWGGTWRTVLVSAIGTNHCWECGFLRATG